MRTKLLTEKEQRELVSFRERIIARALSTEPIDREAAEVAYNNLLENMGCEKVTKFMWFDDPYAMHNQLWDQIRDQLGDQLGGQLRDQLWDQLGGQIRGQLWDQIRDQLRGQIRGQLDQYELQYLMWLDYVAELDGIEPDTDKLETLKLLSKLGEHSFWIVPLQDGAGFCERPIRIARDTNNLLHYDQGAAVEWGSGYKQHYLHGVYFGEDLYNKIINEEIDLENLGLIENADQRAIAVQMLRPDRLLKQVGAKLINTGIKGTKLYQVDNFLGTNETEYCMKMEHPTIKGKFYIEWVEPSVGKKKDADLCQATAFGISKEDYLYAIEA
jgi:hypothetical protein